MDSPPDFFTTAEELFHYLYNERQLRRKDPQRWQLGFRPCDEETLLKYTDQLQEQGNVLVYSNQSVVTWDGDTPQMGPETLVVAVDEVLDIDGVKQFIHRYRGFADEAGLEIVGIGVDDPFDPFMGYGWMELEDASWQLSCLSDQGLDRDEFVPFVFAFKASAGANKQGFVDALVKLSVGEIELVEVSDGPQILLHISGINNSDQLRLHYASLESVVVDRKFELLGVDFYIRRSTD